MENSSAVCVALTSWPSSEDHEPFVRALIEARLVACVHVLDRGRSYYRWNGVVEEATERQLVIKTTRSRVAAVEARLRTAHPYDVPEWLVCDAEASPAYGLWIHESVVHPGEGG